MTGVFALFFFGEVPRVRNDILQKTPIIGSYWKRPIAPEDNVSNRLMATGEEGPTDMRLALLKRQCGGSRILELKDSLLKVRGHDVE